MPGTLPGYCRVDGTIDRRQGVGGQTFGIGFALALPDEWNGRLLMQGGGGLNGRVAQPLGAVAAGDSPALARGFAVVTTDTGHKGAVFDASFMHDQQAALDFAYVAIGRVAVLAKALVAQHYGRGASHSYYAGCSTGGREAMVMAERYPAYFDGIIAGAPAMRTGHSNLALRAVSVAVNQIAPRDAAGKPVPAQAFSESDRQALTSALLDACDGKDGVKDGMIFATRQCRFDPSTLACPGAKAEGCLSQPQVGAIKKAMAGPTDSKGHQVYPGFLYDSGIAASGPGIPGLFGPGAGSPVTPTAALGMDVDAEARAIAEDPQQTITDTAQWTNLTTFSSAGGKLLFYHGVSDPWFSALDTVGYYERLGASNGGADAVLGWSRLFLVPGMGHCGGGAQALDRFDLLTPLVEWVEKGTAPNAVAASGRSFPGRTRPLCAYPQYARYKGTGNSEDAVNFECASR
jgi:feruloyl esterase